MTVGDSLLDLRQSGADRAGCKARRFSGSGDSRCARGTRLADQGAFGQCSEHEQDREKRSQEKPRPTTRMTLPVLARRRHAYDGTTPRSGRVRRMSCTSCSRALTSIVKREFPRTSALRFAEIKQLHAGPLSSGSKRSKNVGKKSLQIEHLEIL
jgi:hypothetical protein